MDNNKTLVMACATVIEEMLPHIPEGMKYKVFDFGLHIHPEKLRATLQEEINQVGLDVATIILGYGMCSQAVIGIKSENCTLVVPRVDDCIAIFLGSCDEYKKQARSEPGTYYLTKGWIEVGDTPFSEYEEMVKRLGAEKAARVHKIMMKNYKRLALINTGQYEMERYREYTRQIAERFGLRYEEIEGSDAMVKKMVTGEWDEDFVVVPPGVALHLSHFFPSME